MRTVQVTAWGGPEVLRVVEAPDPSPGAGEVLIEVEAIEVLFVDTQVRSGWGEDFFPMRPPFVPGTGVMGTVAGPVPRRVVARTGNEGAYAERVVVPADEAVDVPPELTDPAVALAALHDGVLALQRLELTPVGPGSRVLVTAAAGALGHVLVPLARRAGAHVTGAAGGEVKVAAVRSLGADHAVDYRRDGWADELGPFDVVFDGAGGQIGRTAFRRTAEGGSFHAYGAAGGSFGATESERGIRVLGVEQQISDVDWRRYVRTGLAALARGHVAPVIGQRVPLEQAARAHAAIERREVVGKTILVTRRSAHVSG